MTAPDLLTELDDELDRDPVAMLPVHLTNAEHRAVVLALNHWQTTAPRAFGSPGVASIVTAFEDNLTEWATLVALDP